jgi:hypothetical protein
MKKSLSLVKVSFCRALLWNSCTYRSLVLQPSVRIIGVNRRFYLSVCVSDPLCAASEKIVICLKLLKLENEIRDLQHAITISANIEANA